MNKQSMRGFLALVERDFPDEILRIHEPVRRELDITSTVFELERAGRSPIVFFERVEGFEMPVVTNLAGNRRLIAAAMEVEPSAPKRSGSLRGNLGFPRLAGNYSSLPSASIGWPHTSKGAY